MKIELPLKTIEDRYSYLISLGHRVGTDISYKEYLTLTYHWVRYEWARIDIDRAMTRMAKHREKLNTTFAVLDFRRDLNNHL